MYAAATNSAANTLLLFGPQIPRLVPSRLRDLRKAILEDPSLGFLVQIVKELPSLWETTIQLSSPNFRRLTRAKQQLRQLGTFFENQNEEAPRLSAPCNLLLAPLTVVSQIAEYLRLGHKGTVQGFCIGFLAATVIASARDRDDLEKWTATAIRLAVCIGAVVDLDELERSDGGEDSSRSSSTWSVGWTSSIEKGYLERTLASFPEAYISCVTDIDRVTLTIPEGQFTSFARQLADGGLSAKPVGLSGRYHTTSLDRTEIAQQLKLLFQHNENFQFPAAEQLTVPLRSTLDTEIITKGALHEIALDCILVDVCRWYETVQATLDAWDSQPVKIIPIGSSPGAVPRSLKLATDTPTNEYLDQSPLSETSSPSSGITTGNLATGQTTPSGSLPPTAVGTAQPIAVIGMACRYAQSDSLEDFWSLINSGRNATTPVPENRFKSSDLWRNPKGPFFGNFLQDADAFDHRFFGMSAREAASMDPQQRLLLQVSYEAMESAGYADGSESPHRPVGCYIGAGYVEYEDNIASEDATAFSATGAIRAFISGRVSHHFGWTGPSVVFDTACSSSAVAIHHACKALQTNDCSVAIAGGVNVITSSTFYQNLAAASFLNTTGASRAFDAQANGYCRGEGAGVLVLKPLAQAIADNDHILGTITGTAVNQNSSCSPITVPDSQSQSDLYLQALAGGGVLPSEVSYVEAHGTGTPVGDPIECASIRSAFGSPNRTQELVIGSVKDVIGHTEAASGVAGVIKTLLMMQYGIIPKQPNFTRLNPKIPALEPDKMAIATQARPWYASTWRAALINNYGAAGSNAAIVVREYRHSSATEDVINQLPENEKIEYPIFISAKTTESVRAYSAALKTFLDRNPSIKLSDVAYNLARKQNRTLEYASTSTAASLPALRQDLEAIASGSRSVSQRSIDKKKKTAAAQWPAPVVLCFGGQTGRSIYLSRDLVQNTPFLRVHLESCNEVCQSLGLSSFFPRIFDPTPVDDLVFLHAMLFSVQYASAQAWLDAGLQISTLVGHSFGQLTALVVAGSLDLTDGLRLVTGRARLMEKLWGADPGVMLAIEGDTERLGGLLKKIAEKQSVDVACYNGPRNIVLAGDAAAVDAAEKVCRETPGLKTVRLANSHAYHSRLADPILDDLQALASTLTWRKPSIRLETCSPNQSWSSIDAAKIASHTREPVYFGEAVQRIANQNPSSVWLEAGSVSPIIGMVRRALPAARGSEKDVFLSIDLGKGNPWSSLARAASGLWGAGSNVDFWAFHGTQTDQYKWLDLPPYQFAKTKHWIQFRPYGPQAAIETPPPITSLPELVRRLGDVDGEAIFAVDASHEIFELSVKGHAVVGQSLCPAGLYFELAIRAAKALQGAEAKSSSKVPQIENMHILSPLGLKPNGSLRISLKQESNSTKWSFRFFSSPEAGDRPAPPTQHTNHAQGTIALLDAAVASSRFQSLGRLLGRSRYDQIASSPEANRLAGDILYKIFSRVVNYAPYYKGVRNTIAFNGEVVGDVVMPHRPEADRLASALSDPLAVDNFLQVAGIHVNCLQEGGGDDDVSVCNAIGEVLWSESLLQSVSQDTPSKNRTWRVYSNMEAKGKNTLVNDVFVLDPTTGSIVLAFLGAEFTQVSLTSLRRVLSKINGNIITPAPSKSSSLPSTTNNVFADAVLTQQLQLPLNDITRHDDHSTTTTKHDNGAAPSAASGVNQSVRKMLSDIFGMSIEEVQPDADLADLGVDSLMITEISSEIQKHFGVTLSIDDLQDLTDVQSLIRILGGESSTPTPTPVVQSQNEVTHDHEEDDEEKEESNDDGGIAAVANDWLSANRNTFDEDAQEHDLIGFRKAVYPFQAQLVVAYTVEAFADLGCDIRTLRAGERLSDFKYLPKHEKLVAQMHRVLEDANLITLKDGRAIRTDQLVTRASSQELHSAIIEKFPEYAIEHQLLRNTGARLADCLTGRLDPLAVMFGDAEARKLMGDVYATAPLFRAATSFLSRFLSSVCEKFQGKREIRILELGGGTGGTTKTLVDLFEKSDVKQRIVYTFSDVSRSLVAAAKRRFAQYPFMEYAVIDIEKEPPTDLQGRFDLIISTNCIHATSNLVRSCTNIRHLLREDGLLCLVENEENLFWYDLVWGLVEGWWLFEDDRTHALIPAARWKTKLQASGFQWVDWSAGSSEESKILRIIAASPSAQLSSPAVNGSEQELEIFPETQETVIFKHAGSLPLQADIYYPPTLQTGSDARPVALMVHGGGHVMLSRKDIRPKQTQILLDAGFVPVSVDYRLCPETTLEEGPITDVRDALGWVRNTLPSLARKRSDVRINGDRVVAVGWSTGGTLALSLGWSAPSTCLQPPQAILAFYCPTDYEDKSWSRENKPYGDAVMTETYNLLDGVEDSPITAYNPPTGSRAAGGWMAKNDARSRIVLHMNWHGQTVPVLVHGLKKNAQQNGTPQLPTPTPTQVQAISPLAHIRNGSYRTPTFLVHPYEDDLIPWQQAQRTADELCSQGIDSELRLINNAAHLFDMYRSHEGNEEAVRAINDGYAFLSRHARGT
ncbi:uncharacterized protein F4817DRAFT_365335 [Daldinia loculata]|uniref:uncharacterized protein n=1 Tax=Daldinia loculata TaxID=103429 RepID=UPI0020C2DFB7|nr:uncharacterized protein F4817DRAFT_365335 [Daldinia loculata]KAI1647447.1 hypothetical protein F4817DRAFT_365335 [Daldinia loculata]